MDLKLLSLWLSIQALNMKTLLKIKEPFVLKRSEGSSIGIYIIESKVEYLQHFSEIEKEQ